MFGAEFFVALGFVLFVALLAAAGVFRKLLAALDSRGAKIAAELAEAERLRMEAARLLETYAAKRAEAEREAEAILAAANTEALRLEREAKVKLEEFMKRRTAQVEARIAQAELQATEDVRTAAVDLAARAARIMLADDVSARGISRALDEIRAQLG